MSPAAPTEAVTMGTISAVRTCPISPVAIPRLWDGGLAGMRGAPACVTRKRKPKRFSSPIQIGWCVPQDPRIVLHMSGYASPTGVVHALLRHL
ncbi:hypothetical protein GCM10010493_41290 [Streptomyces lavendulae subsp. grasserius]